MRAFGVALAMAVLLAASPAQAAKRSPTPTPSGALPIQGVSVEVQPLQAAPGMPAAAQDGAHIEQPPLQRLFRALPIAGQGQGSLKGFKARPRMGGKPSPSPSP